MIISDIKLTLLQTKFPSRSGEDGGFRSRDQRQFMYRVIMRAYVSDVLVSSYLCSVQSVRQRNVCDFNGEM